MAGRKICNGPGVSHWFGFAVPLQVWAAIQLRPYTLPVIIGLTVRKLGQTRNSFFQLKRRRGRGWSWGQVHLEVVNPVGDREQRIAAVRVDVKGNARGVVQIVL